MAINLKHNNETKYPITKAELVIYDANKSVYGKIAEIDTLAKGNQSEIDNLNNKVNDVLLWENTAGNNVEQTPITLTIPNISNYRFIVIGYKNWYSGGQACSYKKFSVESHGYLSIESNAVSASENLNNQREIERIDNTLRIQDCYSNSQIDNRRNIIMKIYGTNVL